MPRAMASTQFRHAQWELRYAEHIEPINRFVDRLGSLGTLPRPPYVAPLYGGVNAELLNVLQDPGPMTQEGRGSRFICLENDDPTAENMANLLAAARIAPSRAMLWNAYPWYINSRPNSAQLHSGARVFAEVLRLMPKLRVVMLNGGAAQAMWDIARRQGAELPAGAKIISTFHTSRRALCRSGQRAHVEAAFREAAQLLGAAVSSPDR